MVSDAREAGQLKTNFSLCHYKFLKALTISLKFSTVTFSKDPKKKKNK